MAPTCGGQPAATPQSRGIVDGSRDDLFERSNAPQKCNAESACVLRGEHVIVARGEMIERYTRAADQARLARNALARTRTDLGSSSSRTRDAVGT